MIRRYSWNRATVNDLDYQDGLGDSSLGSGSKPEVPRRVQPAHRCKSATPFGIFSLPLLRSCQCGRKAVIVIPSAGAASDCIQLRGRDGKVFYFGRLCLCSDDCHSSFRSGHGCAHLQGSASSPLRSFSIVRDDIEKQVYRNNSLMFLGMQRCYSRLENLRSRSTATARWRRTRIIGCDGERRCSLPARPPKSR